MASIVDSIRSVYQDNYSLLKMGVFSYFIYLLVNVIMMAKQQSPFTMVWVVIIMYLYLGFCSIIISNRINQRISTLPSFNPVQFAIIAFKATLVYLPFSILGFFVVNMVLSLFHFDGVPQIVTVCIVRFFILSFGITALINFSQKYDFKDAFNPGKIMSGLADVLVYTLLCAVVLSIFAVFTAAPVLYLIHSFFKFGPLFNYVVVLFVTMNLAFFADYWGQLHFEIESKNNFY